ncbi:MAG: RND family transporter [Spirochaetales bacterium]|nr:RND family transporter [Spirochaetales bacterium]
MARLFSFPKIIIFAIIAVTIVFAIQLPNMKIDNSVRNFLPKDHPSRVTTEKMDEVFGNNEMVSLSVEFKNGTIFAGDNLSYLSELTEEIGRIRFVKDVLSLSNAQIIMNGDEGMVNTPVVTKIPESDADIEAIKNRLLEWDIYKGILYSDDFSATQLVISFEDKKPAPAADTKASEIINRPAAWIPVTEDDLLDSYNAITSVAEAYGNETATLRIAGPQTVMILIRTGIAKDLLVMFPLVLAVLFIILALALKRLSGVLLIMLTVVLSVVWTFGIMALFDIPIAIMMTAIPILLVAVGSAYGIHMISHYYDEKVLSAGAGDAVREDGSEDTHRHIVLATIRKIGKPVLLAGLTTIAGFGALALSGITMIRYFGIFTAAGVASALVISLLFIPSLLLSGKRLAGKRSGGGKPRNGMLANGLTALGAAIIRRKKPILIISGIVIIISATGIPLINVGKPLIRFFKEETEIRKADAYINSTFSGTSILNVMITGNEIPASGQDGTDETGAFDESDFFTDSDFEAGNHPGEETPVMTTGGVQSKTSDRRSVKNPEILAAMDELSVYLRTKFPEVKKVSSVVDFIKRMNYVLNNSDSSYNEIPSDPEKYNLASNIGLRNLISKYLLLYSGNLDNLIDDMDDPESALMHIQMNNPHPAFIQNVKDAIREYSAANIEPLGYSVELAGDADMLMAVNDLIINTQIMSIAVSLCIVFLIVTVTFRSPVAGLLSLIPIVAAILMNFGIMGYFSIVLDTVTALVASVAIGIGIDYAIHFISIITDEMKKTGDWIAAVKKTLLSSGKAIVFNAVSVAAGFAVLFASSFSPLNELGLLICLTMVTSSVFSITVLPVLIVSVKPKFITKNGKEKNTGKGIPAGPDAREAREKKLLHSA